MDDHGSSTEAPVTKKANWITTSAILLGLGSFGPGNVYFFATDPTYLDKLHGWRIWILPFGVWMLTGMLLNGLTTLWFGGIKRDADWEKRGEEAWAWWLKLGMWLVGIGVVIAIAIVSFAGLASYLSTLDRGTLLIAGLLFMILLALWRIGSQVRIR
jgi:hypothetical protein